MLTHAPTIRPAATRRTSAKPRVAAVIPAYNEAGRIKRVLDTLRETPEVDEIIVVDDGSTDGTYDVLCTIPDIQAVRLSRNKGKGGAMREGALRTSADVLVFFDADLVGLEPQHVRDLVAPVCAGDADMAMGIFQGGRWATDFAQRCSPGITGQRAIRRAVFLRIPNLESVGYGIELAITYYVRNNGYAERRVIIRGVTHPMKEEKLGFMPGVLSRTRMYCQMLRFRVARNRLSPPPPCALAADEYAPEGSQQPSL